MADDEGGSREGDGGQDRYGEEPEGTMPMRALAAMGIAEDVDVEDVDGAGGGREVGGELADEGGLAGAVGAEEAEDDAWWDVEVDGVVGEDTGLVAFGEAADLDGGHGVIVAG